MKKLMHILFLSCLKATGLIEKKLLFSISSKEKVQLKIHKMMCNACKAYEKQSVIIDKTLELQNKTEETLDAGDLKTKILDKFGLNSGE